MWTLTPNGKVNSFLTKGQLPQRRAQLLGAQCFRLRKINVRHRYSEFENKITEERQGLNQAFNVAFASSYGIWNSRWK